MYLPILHKCAGKYRRKIIFAIECNIFTIGKCVIYLAEILLSFRLRSCFYCCYNKGICQYIGSILNTIYQYTKYSAAYIHNGNQYKENTQKIMMCQVQQKNRYEVMQFL